MRGSDKLSDTAVRKAKPRDKAYKLSDGGGMFLLVQPNGAKWWRLKYRFGGKEKLLALGVYPEVTLKLARERRVEARKLLDDAIDPGAHKREQKRAANTAAANSFEIIAREFHKLQSPKWSESHTLDWISVLENFIFPHIGSMPITKIEAPDVLDAIRKIEARGTYEVASRAAQRVRTVFAYAISSGRARHNPAAEIKGAMAPKPKAKHFPAVSPKEVPDFLRAIAADTGEPITQAATRLLQYTFVRTKEMRGARWEEFDFEEKIWTIPAERMKLREIHLVPMSKQVIALLEDLRKLTGHLDVVFPGRSRLGSTISENTVLKQIERIGYKGKMTGHGFRTIASTYLNSTGVIRWDMIEAQLAHATENTRAAYNRADYMMYRQAMMQFWADSADALEAGAPMPRWGNYDPGLALHSAQIVQLAA